MTASFGSGRRPVAAAVDAMGGPQVRLRDIELVARVPSEAGADIAALALRDGAEVRVNRVGEPEVPAWGISMGVEQEWGLAPRGTSGPGTG